MKVKVIEKFKDKHTKKVYEPGTILTISKKRYEEILESGEFVEEMKNE